MRQIPIPNWIPLFVAGLFFLVVWWRPLPGGSLPWHMLASFLVVAGTMWFGFGGGASKLLGAMTLWFGFTIYALGFLTAVMFGIVVMALVWRVATGQRVSEAPVLPIAFPVFAIMIACSPMWSHILGAIGRAA
ncbi:hypothetical protein [Methylocystis parvus]|uniref:Prepilin type IV endopeptidase peptidase domain-containing protein n=1 Tax=Methylocystis parvus TaxID=134 RepID=A0A6B8M189_9HYPH|nr:hypothetical protein [Methylocystis parvus]QGM96631.1 hypothetical protein F7D14_03440 [Methylocystis parvus]WBJ99512.1 hypothetical protein MMG94_16190 [Methylocystis parvus OBBP]